MNFRDELRGSVNKEHYIRDTLGITAPKKSTEYRSAYRYLSLIEQGKRSGLKSEKFRPVVEQATKDAIATERERRGARSDPGSADGGSVSGSHYLGEKITRVVQWTMDYGKTKEQRKITSTVVLNTPIMVRDANERGIEKVMINHYYSDGAYYDEWEEWEEPPDDWWSGYEDN